MSHRSINIVLIQELERYRYKKGPQSEPFLKFAAYLAAFLFRARLRPPPRLAATAFFAVDFLFFVFEPRVDFLRELAALLDFLALAMTLFPFDC